MKIYCKKGISSFLVIVMIMSLFVGLPQTVSAATSQTGTYGNVYEVAAGADATVVGGADVPFSNNGPMSGISHTAGTATVTVPDTGYYKIDYNASLTAGTGANLAIAVNGVVDASTSIPVLTDPGEVSGSVILSLTAGDVITLRNNSATSLTLALAPSAGAQMTIAKVVGTVGNVYQLATIANATVVGGADVPFSNNGPMSGISHTAGTTTITVPDTGYYKVDYNASLTAGTGANLAIAVNGVVDASTSIPVLTDPGEVSGSVILSLTAGDVITLRNNSATSLTLALAPSAGAQMTITEVSGNEGYVYELATGADATVVGGADVTFSNNGPMSGISCLPGTAVIMIPEDGWYKIDYKANMTVGTGANLAIAVNGVVDSSTPIPVLTDTGEVSGSVIMYLLAWDAITLRNNSATSLTLPLAPSAGAQMSIVPLMDFTYTVATYTVTFVGDGNTGGTVPVDTHRYVEGEQIHLPYNPGNLTKIGYDFEGWQLNNIGSGWGPSKIDLFMGNSDLIFDARWVAVSQTISYDNNGGTGTMSNTTAGTDASVTLTSNAFTRAGYTFGGWNTAANGSGTSYTDGQSLTMPAGGLTLYAQWTVTTNIDSDGNGLPDTNIDSDSDGVPDQNIDSDNDGVPDTSLVYNTITYNGNGSTGGAAPAATQILKGFDGVVSTNSGNLAKTSSTFGGWNTAANGSGTSYAAGGSITLTGSITLYAQWTEATYTVSFDSQGGSTVSSQPNVASGATIDSPTAPTKTGYTFGGWYKESGCTNAWNFSTDTVTSNVTLYAKWTAQAQTTYTVMYSANGANSGTVPMDNNAYTSGSTVSVKGNTGSLAKAGFTFGGWSYGGTTYSAGQTLTITGSVTLSAVWNAVSATYTVTFNNNYTGGGTYTTLSNISSGATITEPSEPSRSGHTFIGWYKDSAYVNPWDFNTDTVTANTTLYAKWAANTYDVGGTVKDDGNPAVAVEGATVKVIQGNIQFGNTVTTDSNGYFTVTGVPDGVYNLVVSKAGQEVIVCIIVNGSNYTYSGIITLPKGNKNSKLEVIGAETPNVVVDKLNDVFNDANIYHPCGICSHRCKGIRPQAWRRKQLLH